MQYDIIVNYVLQETYTAKLPHKKDFVRSLFYHEIPMLLFIWFVVRPHSITTNQDER